MVDESKTIPVTARIPTEVHARIEAIRAGMSASPGDPQGGPTWAAILRAALEEWAQRMEASR